MAHVTVRLVKRHPTEALAKHTGDFMPQCGWKPVEESGWWWLEFSDVDIRGRRTVAYLREQFPAMRFELKEKALG